MARFEFFGSMVTEFFWRALAANSAAMFLSRTGSSEETKSSPCGPRICFKAEGSKGSVALIKASAASWGVVNVFWAGGGVPGAFSCGIAGKERSSPIRQQKAERNRPERDLRPNVTVLSFI